jgi:D-glycero-alpha-D-manno-heptose-7-phosphate kinase
VIISRTPFRISFFGGGTDYPDWFRDHGGAVLSTSINKYCYISVRPLPPFFEHRYRIVYSIVENVREIAEIKHPAVRTVLEWACCDRGLEIHHDGDLPARSGLGSSSAFTVGLINALRALEGRPISKAELAKHAIYVEQCLIREPVGSQDQLAAAFGGFNKISFKPDGTSDVAPMILAAERVSCLEQHLMLFFTGISRNASDVARTKIENFKNRRDELTTMRRMVDAAIEILNSPSTPLVEFGRMLHEAWLLKRRLSDRVSTPYIDQIYDRACGAGAIGGKLLGAGGGGFVLLFVEPQNQIPVKAALKELINVPFRFERSGSRIVLYQPNGF